MPLRLAMTLATFIIVGIAFVLSWLVSLRSERWGNRIAAFGLLAMFQGAITVALMPADPP